MATHVIFVHARKIMSQTRNHRDAQPCKYHVDRLTQQIKELQEVVNTLQEVEDFKHFETAGSSVTLQVNSLFFSEFFPVSNTAQAATFW